MNGTCNHTEISSGIDKLLVRFELNRKLLSTISYLNHVEERGSLSSQVIKRVCVGV